MNEGKRLIIVGGSGFAQELRNWVGACCAVGSVPPFGGYIYDDATANQDVTQQRIGTFRDYIPRDGDVFALGVGKPSTKRLLAEDLMSRGGAFVSVIHPTAIVGPDCVLGKGVVMCPYSMNTSATRCGDFVTILSFSGIGHGASVDDFSTLSSHVDIMGDAKVGQDVWLGSGSRVMPRVTVGNRAIIGAGALVMRRVPDGTTIYAAPGKRLKLPSTKASAD